MANITEITQEQKTVLRSAIRAEIKALKEQCREIVERLAYEVTDGNFSPVYISEKTKTLNSKTARIHELMW